MRTSRRTIFLLLLVTCSFYCGIAWNEAVGKEGMKKWSFTFADCPAADAFRQIEETTKYRIILIGETATTAGRTYKNQTVEKVVQDILRNDNYIMTTSPRKGGAPQIVIRFAGSAESSSSPPAPKARPGLQAPPMPPGLPRR